MFLQKTIMKKDYHCRPMLVTSLRLIKHNFQGILSHHGTTGWSILPHKKGPPKRAFAFAYYEQSELELIHGVVMTRGQQRHVTGEIFLMVITNV